MRYISTRGEAPALGFCDAVLAGLAPDGGLYVPVRWPTFSSDEMAALGQLSYAELAYVVISRFVGDDHDSQSENELSGEQLRAIIEQSYATFRHPAVVPLKQVDSNHFLMELFHGPTLAFKDVAMQFLARLMDHILAARGQRAMIVGATSGDTGGAAIEAFRGLERVDIAILFPDRKVSPVQRRQMTTATEKNVRAIAIEGNFDDTQALLKGLFSDQAFRERVHLSGVNSINWGRIVAQIVYYFAAATALGAPHRPVSFTVPTGNFGNIFAAHAARRMGLPIDRLVVATNVNDILHRAIETGRYETRGVFETQSPSMDIQVSSNFERYLFDSQDGDAAAVRRQMASLSQSGAFSLDEEARLALSRSFASGSCDENETAASMAHTFERTGEVVDPHTAVALAVADKARNRNVPMVTLATAHPAKFPDAVHSATGQRLDLPDWCSAIMEKPEYYRVLPADLDKVRQAIEENDRQLETVPVGVS